MNTRITALLITTLAFLVRFLRLGAIENDHYVYLARAHQVLHGDWPVRDFADPGMPLGYLLSAAAAALTGPTLLTEAVLSVALFAIGVGLTYALARRASSSVLIGCAAAAIVLLLPPRLYNSSKMLVPLVAIALAWRYADRPTIGRMSALAAWTGIAFLFRHDYAVYIAAASAAMIAVQHGRHRRVLFEHAVVYASLALAVAAPWLIYVQMQQGLSEYFASAARFSIAEGARTASHWAPIYFAAVAVPVVTLIVAVRGTRSVATAHVMFAGALGLTSDLVLLRDEPAARLPDVYAVTLVIAAIIAGRLVRPAPTSRMTTRTVPAVAVTSVAVVVVVLAGLSGALPERLNVIERWQVVTSRLRDARPEIMPDPSRTGLIEYIRRCTTADERVFVGGFAPELPVLSHRAFAAGMPDWIRGYYEHPADVARARRQLARERVGVAVMLDGGDAFTSAWPALADDLRARGLTTYHYQLPASQVELWMGAGTTRDAATGLPCGL